MKTAVSALVLASAVLFASSMAEAKQKSVAGSWTVTVEHFAMPLMLEQKKTAVTGSLAWPHGAPIKLSGRFDGRTLRFSGDSAGENFTIHVTASAMLKDDGTFDGAFNAHFVDFNDAHERVREHDQEIPWTAQRTAVPSNGSGVHSAR